MAHGDTSASGETYWNIGGGYDKWSTVQYDVTTIVEKFEDAAEHHSNCTQDFFVFLCLK